MKIITSPAKLMSMELAPGGLKSTVPVFIEEANHIQSFLREKSPEFLSELMEISKRLADENWERNQKWKFNPNDEESNQAIYAFVGEVYRGLNVSTLSDSALMYLNRNYFMLSGLYGLLRPSDRVMPYRLEMGRKFEFEIYKNLYAFWKEKITAQLNRELEKDEVLLNLASNEYFKVIDKKKLHASVVDFDFYETKSGKPKTVVVYTKHARGLVVRFCAQTNAQSLDDVKAFNYEGYLIDEEQSTAHRLVFTR